MTKNLLEAAPNVRFKAVNVPRQFSGVGIALIARLIAESYNGGGEGRVQVTPTDKAKPFYRKLGFVESTPKQYLLYRPAAEIVFERATE